MVGSERAAAASTGIRRRPCTSERHSVAPAASTDGLLARATFTYTRAVTTVESFTLLDTTIRVTSDDPATLIWLREVLTPPFALGPNGGRTLEVDVATAPSRYRDVAASRPTGELAAIPCFAGDRTLTYRPGWEHDGRIVADEHRLGALYVLSKGRVEVLASPGTSRVRTATMRVVRELAVARALSDPACVLIHAAAAAPSVGAVLFAGPRECGKTTTLASVVRATRAGVLTNDRTLLRRTADGWTAYGIPTIVNVRPGTLALMPDFAAALGRIAAGSDRTVAEAMAAHARGAATDATKLSVAQLAAALDAERAGPTPLAAIVFPDRRAAHDEITIERMTGADAAHGIATARFGQHAERDVPTAFARLADAARPPGAEEALLARLAVEVPCFSARLGAAALQTAAGGTRLLAAVGRGVRHRPMERTGA